MSYAELTQSSFMEFMVDLQTKNVKRDMEFVMWTGESGMHNYNELMFIEVRVKPALNKCSKLLEDKKITIEEHVSIIKMINSPDRENLVIVESIIEQYE